MDNATQKIDQNIYNELITYVNLVGEKFEIENAYLFGSRARGNANKFSDYDVAIISDEANKNRHEFLVELLKLSRSISIPVEPHPMTGEELADQSYLLGREVKKYGVLLR